VVGSRPDESTGGQVLSLLAERDPLPPWNKPTLARTTPRPKSSPPEVPGRNLRIWMSPGRWRRSFGL